jgi:hypothetical protein
MKTDFDPLSSNYKPNIKNNSKVKKEKQPLFTIDEEVNNNDVGNILSNIKANATATAKANTNYNTNNNNFLDAEEIEEKEKEISNINSTMKKRHSSITFSQRMLKKADNLTKFNRKNHSEGNKHITNDYL